MSEEQQEPTPKPVVVRKTRASQQPKYAGNTRAGRPPRKLENKVNRPLRYLTTGRLAKEIERVAEEEGVIVTDLQRLAMLRFLEDRYKRTGEERPDWLDTDTTFDSLRGTGHV